MRIPLRTSRLAIAARRFSGFGLPIVIIPVILHRTGNIDAETFFLIETIGMSLAGLGIMFGFAALIRLWFTGDQGWGRAIVGVFLGIVSILPLMFAAALYFQYPAVNDVSTSATTSIDLVLKPRPANHEVPHTELVAAFPNLITRDYLLTTNQTYRMVENLVSQRGMQVIIANPPQLERASGRINATETTFLGWTDEIGITVRQTTQGTEVAMRSASLAPIDFDLGRNGRRIESLMRDLDEAVTNEIRNGLSLGAPIPEAPAPRPPQASP